MRKLILILGIILLFFLNIAPRNSFAESGCCLNPNSDVCSVINSDVCCPEEDENYIISVNSPKNQTDCQQNFFYPGNADACLTMPDSLKQKCTMGCCCNIENNQVSFEQKLKLNCIGKDNQWIDNDCNEENCKSALSASDKNGRCDPHLESSDCRQNGNFPLFCTSTYLGNILSGNYSCCNEFECAGEVPINPEEGFTLSNLKVQCFKTGETYNFDNQVFTCYFGTWFNAEANISNGNFCQEVVSRNTSLYYSDIGVCNNKTCEVTLNRTLGNCVNKSICKDNAVDDGFKVCCLGKECAFNYEGNAMCYENGSHLNFNKFNTNFSYYCDNGTWILRNKTYGGENSPCKLNADCSKELTCMQFQIENQNLNKSFCCNSDECAGESKCVKQKSTITMGDKQYQCNPPNWELFTSSSNNDAGGGCNGRGKKGDADAPLSADDEKNNKDKQGNLQEGEACTLGQCSEGLVCIPFSLPKPNNDQDSEVALKSDAQTSSSFLNSGQDNENSQAYCCKDGSCSSPQGCKKAGETIAQDGTDYVCTGSNWEEKDSKNSKCNETQCKVEDGCVDDNETYYNITPKNKDLDLSTEQKLIDAISKGIVLNAVEYKCENGTLKEINRWPKEEQGSACSFYSNFSKHGMPKGNDLSFLLMSLILVLFLLKRQVIDRVKNYSTSF